MGKKEIRLACGIFTTPTGMHAASWRLPSAPRGAFTDIGNYIRQAKLAEAGLMDMFFVADTPAARLSNLEASARSPAYMNMLEPLTLVAALAVSTTKIGLGLTVSTSFYEPYNLARQMASLDHISHGRVAWNVVTSASDEAARNFGLDRLPPHKDRYARAAEFVDLVWRLWDSWDDDAFIEDREGGRYFDPAKINVTEHSGDYFSVHGALNIARPPQGRPVIIQAGASDAGKELAARTADVVFSSDPTVPESQVYYADLKGRMAKYGRRPEELVVLAGISPTLGSSEAEALDKFYTLQAFIPPEVGMARIEEDLETKLDGLDLDKPIPDDRIPKESNFHKAYFSQIVKMIREDGLSLRQLIMQYDRGKVAARGTPKMIVDLIEEWVTADACDGFMLGFPAMPSDCEDFIRDVVPELQRRGLYKTSYAGKTMRDNLGLARPPSGQGAARPARMASR